MKVKLGNRLGARGVSLAVALTAVSLVGRAEPAAQEAFRAAEAVVVYADADVKSPVGKVCVREGAEDLAKALSCVTGKKIAFVREGEGLSGGKPIYLGNTKAAQAAGLDATALPALGYRIRIEKDRAFILAKTGTGAGYGVTGFSERYLGYRFLTFSGVDPYVVRPNVAFPVCDYEEKPAIYYRRLYAAEAPRTHPRWRNRWQRYAIRRRTDTVLDELEGEEQLTKKVFHCHSMFNYLPPEEYFGKHPEYYSMDKAGVRHGVRNLNSQPCMTHPEVRNIITERMLAFIAADRAERPTDYPRIYDFTQMDSSGAMCRCPECRKVAEKYTRVPGDYTKGGDAGLQLEFVNDIARRVAAKYPDVILRTFAYVSTEVPPKGGISPAPNVIIWLCDLYFYSDHELPLTHPFNKERRELLESWAKLARRFEMWDYMLYGDCRDGGGTGGDFPEVNVDAIAGDAKFFHRCGVGRIFMESEFYDQPFYELHAYVMGECWWNPDSDLEQLVRNYCTVYGKGAEKMYEAIGCVRSLIRDNPPPGAYDWGWRNLPWLTVPNLEMLRGKFEAAYALESAGEPRARIALVLATVNRKLAALYGNARETAKRADAFQRAFAMAQEAYRVDYPVNGAGWDQAVLALSSKFSEVRFKDLPRELDDAPDAELFCLDATYMTRAPPSVFIDDPKAERKRAMKVMARAGNGTILPSTPIRCGVANRAPEKGAEFVFEPSKDDAYHWYRLGTCHLGDTASFWIPDGRVAYFNLRDAYAHADGVEEDPNTFDLWISVRYTDALYVDRLALRRKVPQQK